MPSDSTNRFSRIFGSSFVFWFCQNFAHQTNCKVILTPAPEYSTGLLQELSHFFSPQDLVYFPSQESFVFEEIFPSAELVANRMNCMLKIQQKKNQEKTLIIVSEICSLAEKIPFFEPPDSLFFSRGEKYKRAELLQKLLNWGYERMDLVEEKGEFSLRGEVVDIFAVQHQNAYRLNFFDETLESIKKLDTQTQLSSQKIENLELLPAKEIAPSNENITKALDCLRKNRSKIPPLDYQKTLSELQQGRFLLVNKYLPYFCNPLISWLDLLPCSTKIFLWKKERLDFALQTFFVEAKEEHQNISLQEQLPPLTDFYFSLQETMNSWRALNFLEIFENELPAIKKSTANEYSFFRLQNLCKLFPTHWREKLEVFKESQQNGLKVVFCVEQKNRLQHLAEILENLGFLDVLIFENVQDYFQKNTGKNELFAFSKLSTDIVLFPLQESFLNKKNHSTSYLFVSEKDLWSKRTSFQKLKKQKDYKTKISDVNIGDFLVHIEHGIGKYLGLQSIQSSGQIEDFLLIEYAHNAKLYVRADEINYKIQTYNISSSIHPQLSELGNAKWKLKRKKVEQAIQKIAEGLLRIYAERKIKNRPAFFVAQKDLAAFANDFQFIETEDQEQAIQDIFQDLAGEKPMDRLICGDAGFGKTEVAMRAAFQVAITGFQVLMLAPTTVLVNQHFQNFRTRFQNFPIRIEFISSFLTQLQIKQRVLDFQQKKIEILIGTHSLLYKNFTGDSIGLLIIDEEHRFGVRQKEKLREFRASIDVLSMSATPIPRTLNLSLLGIRDISLITTPPQDRKQIKTKVLYFEDNIVKEVVKREVNRGGQVFILYNQVATIESFLEHLKKIIPNNSIDLAHGQMPKKQLEKVMTNFSQNKFSVLLCTTIIESGLDLPNANSLIVYNAAHFGLSQLYQIRGRVGRSNRQAFVYFFLLPDKKITDQAKQRLNILLQFQGREGYKIASQDLELRGVGNLVGTEQSGHLQTTGYDLFMVMLEETIQKIKSPEHSLSRTEVQVFCYIKGYIPEKFIPNMSMRLYIYQTINQCYNEQRIVDFQEELTDRFGLIPQAVMNLFEVIRLKNFAYENNLLEIGIMPKNIKIKLAMNFSIKPQKILHLSKKLAVTFSPNNSIILQKEITSIQDANTKIASIISSLK